MLTAVGVALLASALLGASSRRLARVLPPRTSVRGLSLAASLMAMTTGFGLSVVCFNFLAQLPLVARAGRWSLSSLHSRELVSTSLGLAACLAFVVVSVIVVRRAGRLLADLMAATRARRELGDRGSMLLVVADPSPQAYALPGFVAGRIVVSTGMLAALDGDERRVLLAHEAAHLNHRHHLYVALSELAAAVNPLLAAVPSVVRTSVERWADEDAATAVGDRQVTARAVAKAGLATATAARRPSAPPLLAIAGGPVVARANALLKPPPRERRLTATVALIGILALSVSTSATVEQHTEHRFEVAHAVYVDH